MLIKRVLPTPMINQKNNLKAKVRYRKNQEKKALSMMKKETLKMSKMVIDPVNLEIFLTYKKK